MQAKNRQPTMKDVAEAVGVSIQTVSAVINEKPGLTPETRERVSEAIKRLGYRPYSVARSLRTRQTRTLALVVSDIANPSFATMASAAEDHAHHFGYSVVLYNTHDDIEREAQYMRTAIERWVDGVVFVSAKDQMTSLTALRAAGIPSVAIDRIPEDYDGPSVTLDNLAAGRLAAEHLLSLGHTRLGHIAGPQLQLSRERADGFCTAAGSRGIEPVVCPSAAGWECEYGLAAMECFLGMEDRPTAIFAANDRMAIGAMQAAYRAGLRVPEQLSVIGLDDIELAAYQIPPLTTIRQSFAQLARLGVQLLLDVLGGQEPDEPQIVLTPELVVRSSTAPAPLNSEPRRTHEPA
jgi:DNA-binding LacI/PurR family transcriptional regulator